MNNETCAVQAVFCRFIRRSLGPCSVIRGEMSLSTCSPSGRSRDHLQQVGRQNFPNSGCVPHTLPVPVPTGVSSEYPNNLQSSNPETDGKCLPHRLLIQTHRCMTGGLAVTQRHTSKRWQQHLQPCRKTPLFEWNGSYMFYNITWSIIGFYPSVKNPEILELKLKWSQTKVNWTVWQDIKTHTPLSLICSAHTLMLLSVWPSFYTRLKLKCNLSLQTGSQRVHGQCLWLSDRELILCKHPDRCETLRCTWSPVWVQLKKWVTRRIWGN